MKKKREKTNIGSRIDMLIDSERKKDKTKNRAWLAEQIDVSPDYLSMIVYGKRNLTKEKAEAIAKVFPGTRVQWLLCLDDFRTDEDLYHCYHTVQLKKSDTIDELISLLGYSVEYSFEDTHTEEDGTVVQSSPCVTITSPSGAKKTLPLNDQDSRGSYDHFKLTVLRIIKGQLLVMFQSDDIALGRW